MTAPGDRQEHDDAVDDFELQERVREVREITKDVPGTWDVIPAKKGLATARIDLDGYVCDRYGLMDRLIKHERAQGGTLAFATGIQGSGKTTFLLWLAWLFLQQRETVIWRGRHTDAWHAFPGEVKIWANHPIDVYRVAHMQGARPERWAEVRVHHFFDEADIIERAEPGCLNVVYALDREKVWVEKKRSGEGKWVDKSTRFWDTIVTQLARKMSADWHALVLDEVHEIWEDRPEGDRWQEQAEVRDALADFRKTFNSLVAASHQPDEVDYRILNKIQFDIMCRGAIPRRKSRVDKAVTLGLLPGEAILDSLYFARVPYPCIEKPPFQVIVRPRADGT